MMSRSFSFLVAVASLTIALAVGSGFSGENAENSIAPPGVIFELLALNRDLPTVAHPKYLSPIEIVASPDSQRLYIAEKTAKQVAIVDGKTKTVLKTIKVPNEVTGIAAAS